MGAAISCLNPNYSGSLDEQFQVPSLGVNLQRLGACCIVRTIAWTCKHVGGRRDHESNMRNPTGIAARPQVEG